MRRTDRRLVVGWATGVLSALCGVALLLTSAWLISRAAEQPPVLYLMVAIVGVRAFGVARAVLRYVERLLTHDAAFRLLTDVRVRLYTALERTAPYGFAGRRRGDVVNRLVSDVDALQDRVLRVRLPWSVTVGVAALTCGLVLMIQPASGLVLAGAVAILLVVVPAVVRAAGGRHQRDVAPLQGQLAAAVSEAVVAAPDLIACGATEAVIDRVRRIDGRLAVAQRRAALLSGLGSAAVLAAVGAAVCVVGWLGVAAVAEGRMIPVLLAVVVLAPIAMLESLDALATIEQQRERVASSAARIDSILAEHPDADRSGTKPVTQPGIQPATTRVAAEVLPSRWDLEVRDLRAGWQPGSVVLRGIDLDVPEGAVVTVEGPSGCGKSTLAAVLLSFLAPSSGTVRLGGVPLERLDGAEVRSVVGLLGQDEHVFDTSIRENLRIAQPDAEVIDLERALDRAGLLDFVRDLPAGLDTLVGENGDRLSGGERQRLGLARLLLADHRVLVLDEPTEHLDESTAAALTADLLALAPERSVVLISHSESLLARARAHPAYTGSVEITAPDRPLAGVMG